MNTSNSNTSDLPIKREPYDQRALSAVPERVILPSKDIQDNVKKENIALEETFSRASIDYAFKKKLPWSQRLFMSIILIITFFILIKFVSWERFIGPHITKFEEGKGITTELFSTSGYANLKEKELSKVDKAHQEIIKYQKNGKIDKALAAASTYIKVLEKSEYEEWNKIFLIYWALLHKSKNWDLLNAERAKYIDSFRDDWRAMYWFSLGELSSVPSLISYPKEDRSLYRERCDRALDMLAKANTNLSIQIEGLEEEDDEMKKDPKEHLTEIKLLLIEAHFKKWAIGGYAEEDEPDAVNHRDVALTLCDELGEVEPALRKKLRILVEIRRQWHLFFMKQWIQGKSVERAEINTEMKNIRKKLKKVSK